MLQFESLHIENLSFQLIEQELLLKSINIQIVRNQCIAIICNNEYEKSTLGQILQKKELHVRKQSQNHIIFVYLLDFK